MGILLTGMQQAEYIIKRKRADDEYIYRTQFNNNKMLKAQALKVLDEIEKHFIHDSEHKFHYLLPVETWEEIRKELEGK